MSKGLMTLCITVGGALGGWVGSLPSHGNGLSGWAIIGSVVGGLAGVWVGYRLSSD